MKTQHQINKSQGILNEKTRLDLKINNAWAILVSVVISSFAFGMTYMSMNTKLDMVIQNQKDLSLDFKEWRKQAEARLGIVEIRQNVVVSFLNQHLNVNIK